MIELPFDIMLLNGYAEPATFRIERAGMEYLDKVLEMQETIMNVSILPANFRRMVSGYVEETDEYLRGEGHRPARLYRRKTIE